MDIIALKCPQCSAELIYEEGRTISFCSFCGSRLMINSSNEKPITKIPSLQKQSDSDSNSNETTSFAESLIANAVSREEENERLNSIEYKINCCFNGCKNKMLNASREGKRSISGYLGDWGLYDIPKGATTEIGEQIRWDLGNKSPDSVWRYKQSKNEFHNKEFESRYPNEYHNLFKKYKKNKVCDVKFINLKQTGPYAIDFSKEEALDRCERLREKINQLPGIKCVIRVEPFYDKVKYCRAKDGFFGNVKWIPEEITLKPHYYIFVELKW